LLLLLIILLHRGLFFVRAMHQRSNRPVLSMNKVGEQEVK
jgi:hypothetical protein